MYDGSGRGQSQRADSAPVSNEGFCLTLPFDPNSDPNQCFRTLTTMFDGSGGGQSERAGPYPVPSGGVGAEAAPGGHREPVHR